MTSPKDLLGVGVEECPSWSAIERFCNSHSMCSKHSTGWPSPASTYWHKSFISLVSAVNLAWLPGISSLGWPSASNPPKAMVVSEPLYSHYHCLVLCLCLPHHLHGD